MKIIASQVDLEQAEHLEGVPSAVALGLVKELVRSARIMVILVQNLNGSMLSLSWL